MEGKNLEDFVDGMHKAAVYIRSRGPDYIIAPIVGAVPFIDIFSIVDRKFPIEKVVYQPNSSRFYNRDEITKNWWLKLFERIPYNQSTKFLSVDEVLSGSSLVGGYHLFMLAIDEEAKKRIKISEESMEAEKRKIMKKFKYETVGIAERGHKRNREIGRLITRGIAKLFEFDEIPTIDNPGLNILRLEEGERDENGRIRYLPKIKEFRITEEYLNFLRSIALYCGVNPESVSPKNLEKIRNEITLGQSNSF